MDKLLNAGETAEELGIEGLKIIQSDALYRFTSDAIQLSRFASAKKGEVVADLCSGSGIVGLHFYALHRGVVRSVDMFELQAELADMCARSIGMNGLGGIFRVHNMRVQDIGAEYNGRFSLILCNPPYERRGTGGKSLSESDLIARHEGEITLNEAVSVAAAKLKFGGRLCMCHRSDRAVDLFCSMRESGIEPKRARLLCGKGGRPFLILAEGVKGGKAGLVFEK